MAAQRWNLLCQSGLKNIWLSHWLKRVFWCFLYSQQRPLGDLHRVNPPFSWEAVIWRYTHYKYKEYLYSRSSISKWINYLLCSHCKCLEIFKVLKDCMRSVHAQSFLFTWTTPASCIVIQFSGFFESWYNARAVDLWTFSSCDRRYFTSGATAPSRPKAVLLFPQLQHLAIASAKCLLSLSSTFKLFRNVK